MVNITKYRQEKKGGKIYIRSEESPVCPICLSNLKVIGSRDRKATDVDGEQQTYVIRRLRCKKCGHVHHELPDLLIPYKRHCAETFERALAGKGAADTLNYSLVKRIMGWWKTMFHYFRSVTTALEETCGINFSKPLKLKEIVRAIVNQHLWVHTRSV